MNFLAISQKSILPYCFLETFTSEFRSAVKKKGFSGKNYFIKDVAQTLIQILMIFLFFFVEKSVSAQFFFRGVTYE